jgi:phenol/toluene 2-monooxygenase (NADH) P5/A5
MSYQLTIEPLGAVIEVEEGQTILDAALRQGIYLPHACGHGLCGTCKVEVCGGTVDHGDANLFALMDFEKDAGKTLACCATLQSDVEIEAEIDEDPDAENIAMRDFSCSVSRIETLTPTIKAVYLKLQDSIHFQAGQYVQVEIPGVSAPRAFSIANSPRQVKETGEIELNVRMVQGGVGTAWIHEKLKIGDPVKISGPYGRFLVRKSAKMPMIFMAGGSGLSSPRSMILDLIEAKEEQPITLIYGQRTLEELYYDTEFKALAAAHANFKYVPCLSNEATSSAWSGARGFIHEVAKNLFPQSFAGHKAYLCGPPVMIEACIGTLMQGRLFEADMYTEKFYSAADTQQQRSPLFKRV